MAWQKTHDDGWYSLDETAIGPDASIIGDRLPAHREDEHSVALVMGTKATNRCFIQTVSAIVMRLMPGHPALDTKLGNASISLSAQIRSYSTCQPYGGAA